MNFILSFGKTRAQYPPSLVYFTGNSINESLTIHNLVVIFSRIVNETARDNNRTKDNQIHVFLLTKSWTHKA